MNRVNRLFSPGLALMNSSISRRVAGGDQGEIVAVVLHVLDNGVDRLPPEVLLAAAGEGIGLVDEQRAAERRLEHGSRLRRRLADVAGDEVGSVGLDEVAFGDEAEGAQDLAEQAGHGRLAGPRVAGEHQVVARLQGRQVALLAELLDAQEAGQPAHVGLDGLEADEVVEFGEQFLDRAGGWENSLWRLRRPGRGPDPGLLPGVGPRCRTRCRGELADPARVA